MCHPWYAAPLLVALWIILFLLVVGWGRFLRRDDDVFTSFWLGWAVLLAVLQLAHLFFPIGIGVAVGFLAVGVFGLWSEGWPRPQVDRRAATLGFAVVLFVAWQALGPLRHYDTGFYHLHLLEWLRAEATVPGLGNLHGRLAFNSAFTLWAALCDVLLETFSLEARHAANGLPLAVLSAQLVARLVRRESPMLDAMLVGPLAVLVLGPRTASLSTDAPIFALQIVIFWELLRIFDRKASDQSFDLVVVLAAAAVMIKLSIVIFAGASVFLAAAIRKPKARKLLTASLLGVLLITPWIVRNVVLSGHLAYPVASTALDLDWTIPRPLVLDEAAFVRGFARSKTMHWMETADGESWFEVWRTQIPGVVAWTIPLTILGAFVAAVRRRGGKIWILLLPTMLSLIWWFLTAPEPRFAGASFALLFAGAWAAALRTSRAGYGSAATFAVILLIAQLTPWPKTGDGESNDGPYCSPPAETWTERVSDHGVRVRVPDDGQQCWNWDVDTPCTPYFRPGLIARGSERGDGFRLDDSFTYGDMETVLPSGFKVSPELGVQLVSGRRNPKLTDGELVFAVAGRFLIYARRAGVAELRVPIRELRRGGKIVESVAGRVLVNDQEIFVGNLRSGETLAVEAPLRSDWNDLVVELDPSSTEWVDATIDSFLSIRLR